MTEVLWPDQVRLSTAERLWTSKDLVQENANWYIVHRLGHPKDRPPRPCSRNRDPISVGCQKQNRESTLGAVATDDNQTLARKPLETVTLRRSTIDPRHPTSVFAPHRSNSGLETPLLSRQQSQPLNSSTEHVRPSKRRIICNVRKWSSYRKRQINAAGRELKALILSNERWNWSPITDDGARAFRDGARACRALSSERTGSGLEEVGNVDDITAKTLKHDHNFSTDCSKEVIVPSWRIVETKRRYAIEQTEDLDDEVFKLRHQKLELDEKRRKRWDEQRLRDLELLERVHSRKDQSVNNSRTDPTSSADHKDIEITSVKVIEAEPVIAFGHFIACIPPREFSLPTFICRQSKSVRFKKSSKY